MPASAFLHCSHNLGSVEQIPPGEGREFLVEGQRIAVFRLRSGAVRATQADCPHKQGPLVDGLVGGGTVVCPFHAWKFDLTTGLPVFGDCAIAVFPVSLAPGGDILMEMPLPDQHEAS